MKMDFLGSVGITRFQNSGSHVAVQNREEQCDRNCHKEEEGKFGSLCSLNHRNGVRQWWVSQGVSSWRDR